MADPQITVQYERKFSDGNYGSEGLSLSWTGPYVESDKYVIAAMYAQIAGGLRATVLTELSKSAASRVASAAAYELNPPPPRVPVVAEPPDLEDMPF